MLWTEPPMYHAHFSLINFIISSLYKQRNSPLQHFRHKTNSVARVRERTIPTEWPRLSAKLVSTFADREGHVVNVTDTYVSILSFLDRSVLRRLSASRSRQYFSENLVAPGIEHGPLDLYLGTLTTRPHR
jgi:hypothetical protein